jgi:hypothetical protein
VDGEPAQDRAGQRQRLDRLCVVATHLAEQPWVIFDRGMPYVICDTDGVPVTPQQAKAIIAERWTVPEEVRRRRSRKGKAPQQVLTGHVTGAQGATRRPSPRRPVMDGAPGASSQPGHVLDNRSSIGNQRDGVLDTAGQASR